MIYTPHHIKGNAHALWYNFISYTLSVLNYSSEPLHTYSLVLHSTCAESASGPDTTIQPILCHIIQQCITKKPVRAHIRLDVDS